MLKKKLLCRQPIIKIVFIMLLCVFSLFGFAQQTITVTGSVHSSVDDTPLTGASVRLKGKTTGTATDESGNFSIKVQKGGVLSISSVGYTDQDVVVNSE